MKALTLTQPWATLVAFGEKQVETRGWGTTYRGPLAIHAAQGLAPIGGVGELLPLIEMEPFKTALAPHLSGYTAEERADDLPRGGIVAVVTVAHCVKTGDRMTADLRSSGYDPEQLLNAKERAFGNYGPGRYAWVFDRLVNLHDPIPCRGALGLWDVPEDVRLQLAEITSLAAADA